MTVIEILMWVIAIATWASVIFSWTSMQRTTKRLREVRRAFTHEEILLMAQALFDWDLEEHPEPKPQWADDDYEELRALWTSAAVACVKSLQSRS